MRIPVSYGKLLLREIHSLPLCLFSRLSAQEVMLCFVYVHSFERSSTMAC